MPSNPQTAHEPTLQAVPGAVAAPQGFLCSATPAGIKKQGVLDLGLIFSEAVCSAAAVLTTNQAMAAPLVRMRKIMRKPLLRAVIVNSGNANACTGPRGLKDAEQMAVHTAKALSVRKEEVAVASTGVIGLPLPLERMVPAIPVLAKELSKTGGMDVARSIMTTDTRPKAVSFEWSVQGSPVRIGGIGKGSGMIHPNMATMLAFVTTDASIDPPLLQSCLREAVDASFHRITVDGDMSTNDMVLVLANGLSRVRIQKRNLVSSGFRHALEKVCLDLAQAIVLDGEGATKFITVRVIHGRSKKDCLQVAKKIACSLLVKTAVYGEDANWGRIMAAAGASGVPVRPDRVDIHFGHVPVVKQGVSLGSGQEKMAGQILKKDRVVITVDLHGGTQSADVYTSDLSPDYVKINADYRS